MNHQERITNMKTGLIISLFLAALVCNHPFASETASEIKTIYGFTVKDINGNEVKLDQFKGKVLLIVNTASKCGYTPQYKALQEVYKKYEKQGLVILGVPANNYGKQEPGTNDEIKEFCSLTYNVTFPMLAKVSVKGDDIAPLFKYLTTAENADFKGDINWNFEKFLVDKNGKLIHRYRSKVTPDSEELVTAIQQALDS
jgi:glutathione peroxidase